MNARPHMPAPPNPGIQAAALVNRAVSTIIATFLPERKSNPLEEIEEHFAGEQS